ncbi:MAG: DUF6029 family protein [Flavobacteriales bacterium]
MNKITLLSATLMGCFLFSTQLFGQEDKLNVSGNIQGTFQTSKENTNIGSSDVPEKVLMNAFSNLRLNYKDLTLGMRFEYYNPPILGIDKSYEGEGISYLFANYKIKDFDFTVGNFYDQFGSGLIFRSYEERDLGYDNAMKGVHIKYQPKDGIQIKGFVGKQRLFWDLGPGYVRGIDGEINLNSAFDIKKKMPNIDLGASLVSRYQENTNSLYNITENTHAYSLRMNSSYKGVNLEVEYTGKSQDPSSQNDFLLNEGKALLINTSYSTKGFGASFSLKHLDNFDFRSDREATGQNLLVNFNPALTRINTYALATFFPYATQNSGETGMMAEINYKVSKKTPIIGGMYITANYSNSYKVEAVATDSISTTNDDKNFVIVKESVDLFSRAKNGDGSDYKLFEEFYIEGSKKINKKLKLTAGYMYTLYNTDLNTGISTNNGNIIYANFGVIEAKYKLKKRQTLRMELQHLATTQIHSESEGNWAQALIEYSKKGYFVAFQDLYNYGHSTNKVHYPTISAGFTNGVTKVSATYGQQRAGIFCIGGVCRTVPASDGLTLTITSTF